MISAEEEVNLNENGLLFDNALKTETGIEAHIKPALSPAESVSLSPTGLPVRSTVLGSLACSIRVWVF